MLGLTCPKCGKINEESWYTAYHFECDCGTGYDRRYCQRCDDMVTVPTGGTCPNCGETLEA